MLQRIWYSELFRLLPSKAPCSLSNAWIKLYGPKSCFDLPELVSKCLHLLRSSWPSSPDSEKTSLSLSLVMSSGINHGLYRMVSRIQWIYSSSYCTCSPHILGNNSISPPATGLPAKRQEPAQWFASSVCSFIEGYMGWHSSSYNLTLNLFH